MEENKKDKVTEKEGATSTKSDKPQEPPNVLDIVAKYAKHLLPATSDMEQFLLPYKNKVVDASCRAISLGCGSGELERFLALRGFNVLALETIKALREKAIKRQVKIRSIQVLDISALDIVKYVAESSVDLIFSMNSRLSMLKSVENVGQFLKDCKVFGRDPTVVLHFFNFDSLDESVKTIRFEAIDNNEGTITQITDTADNKRFITQDLITKKYGTVTVFNNFPIVKLNSTIIKDLSKDAGFKSCKFYGSFDKAPLSAQSADMIAVLC